MTPFSVVGARGLNATRLGCCRPQRIAITGLMVYADVRHLSNNGITACCALIHTASSYYSGQSFNILCHILYYLLHVNDALIYWPCHRCELCISYLNIDISDLYILWWYHCIVGSLNDWVNMEVYL